MVTLTVTRRPTRDKYGDRSDATPQTHTIDEVKVAPRTSDELTAGGRAGVIAGYTVYAPPGSDLQAHDEVAVSGMTGTFDVDGEPFDWGPGVVAELTRRVG